MDPSSEGVHEGRSWYQRPTDMHVDCPDLRVLEDHLWTLADTFADLPPWLRTAPHSSDSSEWSRVSQWLRMASGLQYVDVDTAYGHGMVLCGRAADFDAANDRRRSIEASEHTRLLYTWNAMERLLRVLRLPQVAGGGAFAAAAAWLVQHEATAEFPEHFHCVRRHLIRHLEAQAQHSSLDRGLEQKLLLVDQDQPITHLIWAGHLMRHPTAHGDLDFDLPDDWDEATLSRRPRFPRVLHPYRLAIRGLALSMQMLLATSAPPDVRAAGVYAPTDGWMVQVGSSWRSIEQPHVAALVRSAHVEPPNIDDLD